MIKLKIWNNLTSLQKRLALIVSIVIAVTYLYPKAKSVIEYISGLINFHNQRELYGRKIDMLVKYIEVDKGLAIAQMERVDSLQRYVFITVNGNDSSEEIKVDIRKNRSGDFKIFVKDGNVGMYAVYYNYSKENWEYYDFKNNHHLTYTKK